MPSTKVELDLDELHELRRWYILAFDTQGALAVYRDRLTESVNDKIRKAIEDVEDNRDQA